VPDQNQSTHPRSRTSDRGFLGWFLASLAQGLFAMLAAFAIGTGGAAIAEETHHEGETHSSEHPYHPHTIGVFVGYASEDQGVREAVGSGLEYERRFNENFGIGGVIEHTWGNIDTWVFVIPFAYHNGPWKLYAGPGVEDGDHGTENLIRLGVEYGFHVNGWEISPQLDLDIVERESEVWVVGVVFARGFEF
jgi:hypothetical protein